MAAQVSSDVRALFNDLGVVVGDAPSGVELVIDRFEQWRDDPRRGGSRSCGCWTCRVDVLEAA